MTVEAVLGLDAGTTSTKAAVMGADGNVVAVGNSDPIPMVRPEPGAAEQEPAALERAVVEAIRRALAALPHRVRIAAVAIAAQSGSVIPIGGDDRPSGNLLTWMDARAASIVDGWSEAERDLIRSVSGWSPSTGLGLASISWLRATRPERYGEATRWTSVDDYLGHFLTGGWRTNPSNASGMQLMDITRTCWDDRLCDLAGIRPEQLSPIHPTGMARGTTSANAAAMTTLEPAIPVVVGGHDQACAALALGATSPGVVVVSAGTAWVLTAITDRIDVDNLPSNVNLSPHVVDDVWSASRNLGGLGVLLDWWQDQPGGAETDLHRLGTNRNASTPDAPFFIPDLGGDSRGAWGRFVPAEPDDRAGRARAVLEAAVFEVRRALESIVDVTPEPRSLTFVGGGARSRRVRQLLADVTGLSVTTHPDASWPALGAASIGATSRGWPAPDLVADASELVEPAAGSVGTHDQRYETYRRLVEGEST